MPMPRKEDPARPCVWCGNPLRRKRFNGRLEDRTQFLRRKFCDQTCMSRGYVKPTASPSALRKRATRFRGMSCESCGATEDLQAHHIDGNLRNNSPQNIQTLCASCHSSHHHRARRAGKTVAGRLESPVSAGVRRIESSASVPSATRSSRRSHGGSAGASSSGKRE